MIERLLEAAYAVIAGPEANAWLWAERERVEADAGAAIFYEQVVDEMSWEAFLSEQMPRLEEHLLAKRERPPGSKAVRIFLWREAKLYAFAGPEFYAAVERASPVPLLPTPKREG